MNQELILMTGYVSLGTAAIWILVRPEYLKEYSFGVVPLVFIGGALVFLSSILSVM